MEQRTILTYPERVNVVIALLYELKMIAVSLMQTSIRDGGKTTAGPSCEYVSQVQAAVA